MALRPESQNRTFHTTCHCRSSTFTFTIPNSQLPIPAHFCHCSICRYTHGTLLSVHAHIPAPENIDFETLTAYKSTKDLTKWFCTTCGAHMLDCVSGVDAKERDDEGGQGLDGAWSVGVSLVDAEESVWDFADHIFVEGTGDGGLAPLLEVVNGKKVKMWKERPVDEEKYRHVGDWNPLSHAHSPASNLESRQDEHHGGGHDTKLRVKCQCGGIDFFISNPTSPASFSGLDASLIPDDKSKWLATHDVCTSCRLVTSSAIVSWIFPAMSALSLPDGSAYPPNGLVGTAQIYKSSDDVSRTFCATCGASVAYSCADRPEMVDVALGLVRAGDVRAEKWVEWRMGKVSYEEDAVWKGVLKSLKEGLERSGDRSR